MKLTIVAATGGIGRDLLEQAVAAGPDVTAVVRSPGKLSREVRAVTTDRAGAVARPPQPAEARPWRRILHAIPVQQGRKGQVRKGV